MQVEIKITDFVTEPTREAIEVMSIIIAEKVKSQLGENIYSGSKLSVAEKALLLNRLTNEIVINLLNGSLTILPTQWEFQKE